MADQCDKPKKGYQMGLRSKGWKDTIQFKKCPDTKKEDCKKEISK